MVNGYSAYNLTDDARRKVLGRFPSKHCERVIADHVMHEAPVAFDSQLPPPAKVCVVGYAQDEYMEVAVVEVSGSTRRSDGETYHITLSLDTANRRPEDAKRLLARGWDRIEPFQISVRPAIN